VHGTFLWDVAMQNVTAAARPSHPISDVRSPIRTPIDRSLASTAAEASGEPILDVMLKEHELFADLILRMVHPIRLRLGWTRLEGWRHGTDSRPSFETAMRGELRMASSG
jgi:hypothetical protein